VDNLIEFIVLASAGLVLIVLSWGAVSLALTLLLGPADETLTRTPMDCKNLRRE
jgi:hypothetical protein